MKKVEVHGSARMHLFCSKEICRLTEEVRKRRLISQSQGGKPASESVLNFDNGRNKS